MPNIVTRHSRRAFVGVTAALCVGGLASAIFFPPLAIIGAGAGIVGAVGVLGIEIKAGATAIVRKIKGVDIEREREKLELEINKLKEKQDKLAHKQEEGQRKEELKKASKSESKVEKEQGKKQYADGGKGKEHEGNKLHPFKKMGKGILKYRYRLLGTLAVVTGALIVAATAGFAVAPIAIAVGVITAALISITATVDITRKIYQGFKALANKALGKTKEKEQINDQYAEIGEKSTTTQKADISAACEGSKKESLLCIADDLHLLPKTPSKPSLSAVKNPGVWATSRQSTLGAPVATLSRSAPPLPPVREAVSGALLSGSDKALSNSTHQTSQFNMEQAIGRAPSGIGAVSRRRAPQQAGPNSAPIRTAPVIPSVPPPPPPISHANNKAADHRRISANTSSEISKPPLPKRSTSIALPTSIATTNSGQNRHQPFDPEVIKDAAKGLGFSAKAAQTLLEAHFDGKLNTAVYKEIERRTNHQSKVSSCKQEDTSWRDSIDRQHQPGENTSFSSFKPPPGTSPCR